MLRWMLELDRSINVELRRTRGSPRPCLFEAAYHDGASVMARGVPKADSRTPLRRMKWAKLAGAQRPLVSVATLLSKIWSRSVWQRSPKTDVQRSSGLSTSTRDNHGVCIPRIASQHGGAPWR